MFANLSNIPFIFFGLWICLCSLPADAAKFQCSPFHWATDVDGMERAAMLVNAVINGQEYQLQFDTGADISALYQPNPETEYLPAETIRLGDISLAQEKIRLKNRAPNQAQGRIGLKSLKGHIIAIDYPQQTICLWPESHYASSLGNMHLIPAKLRSNKLFLHSKLDGKYQPGLFFDTGASPYTLLVDKKLWQQLTTRQGDEAGNDYSVALAHNQLITTIGAPMTGDMVMNSYVARAPKVYFTRERPQYFANYPIDAAGIIGNALFFEHTVVLDLRSETSWFGVIKKRQ